MPSERPRELGYSQRGDGQLDELHPAAGRQRVAGKPYTVSEYNHPFPNQYARAADAARLRAARLGRRVRIHLQPQPRLRAAPQHLFLQHDAAPRCCRTCPPARPSTSAATSGRDKPRPERGVPGLLRPPRAPRGRRRHLGRRPRWSRSSTRQPWTSRAGPARMRRPSRNRTPKSWRATPASWSGTGASRQSLLTVNTPNTKLFSGFPEGREIALGGVKPLGDAPRLGHGLAHVARDGLRRRAAATLLLAATGVTENEGTLLEAARRRKLGRPRRPDELGRRHGPGRGIPAAVTPSDPARTTCYALDERGDARPRCRSPSGRRPPHRDRPAVPDGGRDCRERQAIGRHGKNEGRNRERKESG